jgi:hypothetical protein
MSVGISTVSRRERHLLKQWMTLRDRGFGYVLWRRSWVWIVWIACLLPGMLIPGPSRPYVVGALIGIVVHNIITLRASHAFWPIMRRYLDWQRIEATLHEQP